MLVNLIVKNIYKQIATFWITYYLVVFYLQYRPYFNLCDWLILMIQKLISN